MCHFDPFHLLWMNASQTGCQCGTFIHFLLKRHYERMTQMIRRLDWVSGFVICITTAQLCVQNMKRCIKAHDCAHTPLTGKKGEMTEAIFFFFLLLLANHSVRELITICFLPASENVSIYQSLCSSGLDYSLVILQLLSLGFNGLIDFTRQPPGIIIWHHILRVIAEHWLMLNHSQSKYWRNEEQFLLHRWWFV